MPYENKPNRNLGQITPTGDAEVPREGHIGRELSLMDSAIDELGSKVKVFVNRVSSIMDNSPGTQAANEKCPQQVFQTPLAERIHQQRLKVDGLIDAVNAAIGRVEL